MQSLLLQVTPQRSICLRDSHSKHNPEWNKMKLSMLAKQLRRFLHHGIQRAEVRLGYDGDSVDMTIEAAMKEVGVWTKRRQGEVGDGEISVRPCLPRCWDGNAK